MKYQFKKLLLIIVFLFFVSSLNAQWQQTSTPPGGSVWAIAVIGNNLFAGATNGGVYFSSDNGITWTQRNGAYTTMQVYSLTTNGVEIYAGTGGSFGGGVYKSSDNGLTWLNVTPIGVGINYFDVRALAVNGTDIFAGTTGNSIYKTSLSSISTSSWSTFKTGLPNQAIRSLAFSGSNILAGTYGDGVWISPSANTNWVSTSSISSSADYIQSIAVNGSNVYAGNISGSPVLYLSTNNGLTWTPSNTSLFSNKPVYAIINKGNDIYVGTEGEGAFLSTDNGLTWNSYNNGFKNSSGNWYCNQINIRSFAFIGNKIFAGTDCGVWSQDTSSILEVSTVNDIKNFSVYPNPTNNHITLDFGSSTVINEYILKINNSLGQLVFTSSINQQLTDIFLPNLNASGIYYLNIIDSQNNTVAIRKIVLQ